MRRWLGAAALAGVLVAGFEVPAQGAVSDDSCGDANPADRDLSSVSFVYSASSFQVRTVFCGSTYESTPRGPWQVVVHVGGLPTALTLVGIMNDVGKYAEWSGFHACLADPCPIGQSNSSDGVVGPLTPAGQRIENDDFFAGADRPELSARSGFGYGSWAEVLPAGTTIPDSLDVWAETDSLGSTPQQLDRTPDTGTISSARNTSPIATSIRVTPGPAPTWAAYGALRRDAGTLLDATGAAVLNRYVAVPRSAYGGSRSASDANGQWATSYRVPHNTQVTARFPGDGVSDPASASYEAYVKAFVSLDLPASTWRRGSSVRLKGVVRPRQSGRVDVLVREDKPGATYRLRYGSLVQDQGDSYYDLRWSPTVRGRYVLRARWNGGSTADGSVLSNISTYRYVTVS